MLYLFTQISQKFHYCVVRDCNLLCKNLALREAMSSRIGRVHVHVRMSVMHWLSLTLNNLNDESMNLKFEVIKVRFVATHRNTLLTGTAITSAWWVMTINDQMVCHYHLVERTVSCMGLHLPWHAGSKSSGLGSLLTWDCGPRSWGPS